MVLRNLIFVVAIIKIWGFMPYISFANLLHHIIADDIVGGGVKLRIRAIDRHLISQF